MGNLFQYLIIPVIKNLFTIYSVNLLSFSVVHIIEDKNFYWFMVRSQLHDRWQSDKPNWKTQTYSFSEESPHLNMVECYKILSYKMTLLLKNTDTPFWINPRLIQDTKIGTPGLQRLTKKLTAHSFLVKFYKSISWDNLWIPSHVYLFLQMHTLFFNYDKRHKNYSKL